LHCSPPRRSIKIESAPDEHSRFFLHGKYSTDQVLFRHAPTSFESVLHELGDRLGCLSDGENAAKVA
jgi:hypothetical protein